jgi:hypothetical protein
MITIRLDDNYYEIPEEVAARMGEYNTCAINNYNAGIELQAKLSDALEAIAEYRLKEQTMNTHPTRDTKIEHWRAKKRLFELVDKKVLQSQLFR